MNHIITESLTLSDFRPRLLPESDDLARLNLRREMMMMMMMISKPSSMIQTHPKPPACSNVVYPD